ncbi:hypothetical protein [Streptomyces ardesiacus]|uniref:hypothetical protein n=1 Tax=Streptomyces ardesiacus TaxID=285564 RepID=UPI0036BD4C56
MDLDRTPSEIAASAAEEIRALNHRTIKSDSYLTPPDLAYTAGHITSLVQRLSQTLQQMEAGIRALDEGNKIRLADRHPSEVSENDIAHAVSAVVFGLSTAREAIGRAEPYLREANQVLNGLGGPWPEADNEED